MKRRSFIKNTTASGLGLFMPISSSMLLNENITKITLLHTNDVHSRIDPFPMDYWIVVIFFKEHPTSIILVEKLRSN